jgi:hypothetical protein
MKLSYEAKILSENNCGGVNNSRLKRGIRSHRLDELEHFPCSCPLCNENDRQSAAAMSGIERQKRPLNTTFTLVFLS